MHIFRGVITAGAALALAASAAQAQYVKVNEPTGALMGDNGGVVVGVNNGDRVFESGLCNQPDGAFGAFPAYYYTYASTTAPPGAAGYTSEGYGDCSGDAPRVSTGSVLDVTAGAATLNGRYHGKGLETTRWYELTAQGGETLRVGEAKTNGWDTKSFRLTLEGLSPETTYQVRLVARNSTGETRGTPAEFTTCPAEGCPVDEGTG